MRAKSRTPRKARRTASGKRTGTQIQVFVSLTAAGRANIRDTILQLGQVFPETGEPLARPDADGIEARPRHPHGRPQMRIPRWIRRVLKRLDPMPDLEGLSEAGKHGYHYGH